MKYVVSLHVQSPLINPDFSNPEYSHSSMIFFKNQFTSSIFYLISPDIHILTMNMPFWNDLYNLLWKTIH